MSQHVIAKVKNEVTKEVLERIGADLVIYQSRNRHGSLAKDDPLPGLKFSSWMKQ